jgi:hypothetical protein
MRLVFDWESEMEGCARSIVGSRPHAPSVRLHDRAGNGQTHTRSLWFRGMERIENLFSTSCGNPTPVSLIETIT